MSRDAILELHCVQRRTQPLLMTMLKSPHLGINTPILTASLALITTPLVTGWLETTLTSCNRISFHLTQCLSILQYTLSLMVLRDGDRSEMSWRD